jgi:hypothetical protein
VPYIQRRLHDPSAPGVALPTGHLVRFYNLMLHPRREAREARWYGAAPAGSLLVWVDSMYEHTDSTLDRTLGQWANVRRARWLLPENAQRQMFFKILGQEEPGSDGQRPRLSVPRSHGDFTICTAERTA